MNMIVVVVLALVFLGIGVTLIVQWGNLVGDEIPKIINPDKVIWSPDSTNPVMFSPSSLSVDAGDNEELVLQIYNSFDEDVSCKIQFAPGEKDDLEFVYASANRPIPPGMVGEWKISVGAPRSLTSDVYVYTANIDCVSFKSSKDIMITVE
jgi:hypothetical protein